ncbi:MAG: PH domain-containing protein [Pseudomonadota bacterium]|nr:PH domain-containing protein [Pseudomonadota bacterium]
MAGYVEKTLASDEEILYRANFNWTYSFFPVLWFALGSAPAVMFLALQFGAAPGADLGDMRPGWIASLIAFACGSLILLFHLIVLWTTEIAVTTYRFVYKIGLISRSTQEVSLNKIEEITLHQTIWGRLFGYGQLVIRGTGVGVITLPNLDEPIEVRKRIENAKSALRRESGRDERRGDDD